MMWLFLIAAIGTSDLAPSRCWELPETEPVLHSVSDELYDDSLNMKFIGNWPFGPSYAVAVDSARELVFLGSGGGVYILDVSTPSEPRRISEKIRTRGDVMDMFYRSRDQNLYIADGDVTLEIWNVEDPASPIKLGSWDNPPPIVGLYLMSRGVTVLDSFAYVIDNAPAHDVDDGLHVINVSDPLSPHRVGFLGLSTALAFAISGSHAYVACGDYGLQVVDISNPSNPRWECPGPDGVYTSITISDSHAYVSGALNSGESGFIVLDISNHLNVHAVGCCSTAFAKATVISDSCAYGTSWNSGLYVIDISDVSNPHVIGHYDTSGLSEDIAITGLHAYIAEAATSREKAGLRVVDVSAPAAPNEVSYWDVPGIAETIVVKEPYAYMGARDGLWVLDISDSTNPRELGHCDVCGYHRSMVVSDSYAYVAASEDGLRIVDIADPALPQEISHYLTPGFAQSVAVSEPYVYVALQCSGFCVVNVSDPLNPQETRVYESWEIDRIVVSDSCAYAVGDSGLTVIDVSNPAIPVLISSCDDIPGLSHVAVSDSCAYCLKQIWNLECAVHIFDISNPSDPVWTSAWDRPVSIILLDIAAWNGWAAIAYNSVLGGESMFCCPWLIDVSDREDPQTAGYYRVPGVCTGVTGVGSHVYTVGNAGLQIYEFYGAGVEEKDQKVQVAGCKLQVSPNPFVGFASIQYHLTAKSKVSLKMHDASGRLVRVLVDGEQEAGSYDLCFDVRELPAGIYFVSMTRGSEWSVTKKLTVIK
jgi:hypothetical protein